MYILLILIDDINNAGYRSSDHIKVTSISFTTMERIKMTQNINKLKDHKGVSLLEVIISLGILAFSLTGVLSGLANGHRWFGTTREMGQAAAVAQQEIERLRSLEFSQVVALAPQYTFAPNSQSELSKHSAIGTVTITSINANQVQIVSNVTWTDSMGSSRTQELASLVTQNGIAKQ